MISPINVAAYAMSAAPNHGPPRLAVVVHIVAAAIHRAPRLFRLPRADGIRYVYGAYLICEWMVQGGENAWYGK
jgi:hypothetical protein